MATITQLNVNGTSRSISADSQESLLIVLRDHLGLTGSKYGCGEGQCGACTVLIEGTARRSCITRVGTVADKRITTIEGLATRRPAASSAASFSGRRRDAVRLLHFRHDHVRCFAAEWKCQSLRERDFGFHGRQRLPLRHAAAHYRRDSESSADAEGCGPMTDKRNFDFPIERERYELQEAPPYRFETDRREFFKYLGAGVLIVCAAKATPAVQESGGGRRHFGGSVAAGNLCLAARRRRWRGDRLYRQSRSGAEHSHFVESGGGGRTARQRSARFRW